MSTRANIEVYDGARRGVMLYHGFDGHPWSMGPELEHKLDQARAELDEAGHPDWWNSQTVGALIVKLSANEDVWLKNVPGFQPCLSQDADAKYLWRVYLGPENGEYEIQCFRIGWDRKDGVTKGLARVDWRRAVES